MVVKLDRREFIVSSIPLGLVGILQGCTHFNPKSGEFLGNSSRTLSEPFASDLSKLYRSISSAGFTVEEKVKSINPGFALSEVELKFETPYGYRKVSFDYYKSTSSGKKPAIAVLPIMGGGKYPIESYFANGFAGSGFNAIILHRQKMKDEIDSLEDVDRMLRNTVFDHKYVVDWLMGRQEVDSAMLGLFGISFGAIKGSLIMSLEPRFSAGVFCLGGGDLPHILANTEYDNLKRERNKLLAKLKQVPVDELVKDKKLFGEAVKEGEELLRSSINYDPLKLARNLPSSRVMMIFANQDDVVPYADGIKLWEAAGRPEKITVLGGHFSSIVYVPWIKSQAVGFFSRKFGVNGKKDRDAEIKSPQIVK